MFTGAVLVLSSLTVASMGAPAAGARTAAAEPTPGPAADGEVGVLNWAGCRWNASGERRTYILSGDWDGDGDDTPGFAFDDGSGFTWHLRDDNSGGDADHTFAYGRSGDFPAVGDWDGDGRDTVGISRTNASGLTWHLRDQLAGGEADRTFDFGPADVHCPVAGDWDGAGGDGPGYTLRNSGSLTWYLRNALSAGPANHTFPYGTAPGGRLAAED
ncbi:hypothetical protein Misp01_69820 [Microtetraspora sp. NBRC 13810]|nr:hypothetical protein Misp01_69820 [Microtetraspora sp. NBRC 13810]